MAIFIKDKFRHTNAKIAPVCRECGTLYQRYCRNCHSDRWNLEKEIMNPYLDLEIVRMVYASLFV